MRVISFSFCLNKLLIKTILVNSEESLLLADFPQMFVKISPFFLLPFFFENCSAYSNMGFRNISHFSIMRLHRELLISIFGSFSWDNDFKFLSKCPKTIARKMLFSCEHLRNVSCTPNFCSIAVLH